MSWEDMSMVLLCSGLIAATLIVMILSDRRRR